MGDKRQHQKSLALILLSVLLLTACGKIGEPVPPQPRTPFRSQRLEAVQQGNSILLTWPQPDVVELRRLGFRLARFDIYRSVGTAADESVDPSTFSERAQLIGSLNVDEPPGTPAGTPVHFQDGPLRLFGIRLQYGFRFLGEGGRRGPFSNIQMLLLEARVPEAPADLQIVDQAQDVVAASWRAPGTNIDGSTPPAVIGYNLYRREADPPSQWSRLNGETPVGTVHFLDRRFAYGRGYLYTVRAVTRTLNGHVMESADAPPVEHAAIDRFPPMAPEGLTAASANLVVNLFWTASPDPDLAGYNIYRSLGSDATPQWRRLNDSPHPLTTYRDEGTVRGTTYLYRVTAVDRTGNESTPSAAVTQEAN